MLSGLDLGLSWLCFLGHFEGVLLYVKLQRSFRTLAALTEGIFNRVVGAFYIVDMVWSFYVIEFEYDALGSRVD